MTDRFAVVHTSTGTTIRQQPISSSDIQGENVQWAILLIYGASANGSNSDHARTSTVFMGFPDGVKANARNRAAGSRAIDARPTVTLTHTAGSSTLGFVPTLSLVPGTLTDGRCVFHARITNGFEIDWTEAPAADYRMTVIFGGGHSNVYVDHNGAVTGGTSVSEPGFEPDCVFSKTHIGSFSNPVSHSEDANPTLGFAINDGVPTQSCIYGYWNEGVNPTDADANVSTTRSGGGQALDVERHWRISAFTANGFTATATTGTCNFCYLAIALSDPDLPMAIAVETLPSGTGTTAFTGLGIQPAVVIHCENLQTTVDSFADGAGASTFGMGAFSTLAEGAGSMRQQEGFSLTGVGTDTDCTSYANSKAIALTSHLGAVASEATLASMNATGFSLAFTTATAGRMVCFAFGVGSQTLVDNESVQISDAVSAAAYETLVVNETVLISEGDPVLQEQDAALGDEPTRGNTLQGGAVRGFTGQGGAEFGNTAS